MFLILFSVKLFKIVNSLQIRTKKQFCLKSNIIKKNINIIIEMLKL